MINGKRVMVVFPAYNAGRTLERTISEIPQGVVDDLLLVDDASGDNTVEMAKRLGIPFVVQSENRGYGGNQKTCYAEALARGADIVIMLHPDYLYSPRLTRHAIFRFHVRRNGQHDGDANRRKRPTMNKTDGDSASEQYY